VTPSPTSIIELRTWSATTRNRTSSWWSGPVATAGELLGLLDDREHGVDLVHVLLALQQERHPLQAHARVDVALRQRAGDVEVVLAADRAEHLLHEHQVPELEVAVLDLGRHVQPVPVREVRLGAVLRAAVVDDLRARTTGPGHAHGPVVLLLAQAHDPLVRKAGDLLPEVDGLRVVDVHARVEPGLLQPPAAVLAGLGDEVPGQLDGAFLEVVAEGEVPAHLEERAVPGGLADVLDVGRADALLHAHRAVVRRGLLARGSRA
jgi:hypothetical protein